jgi:hypothetical protein
MRVFIKALLRVLAPIFVFFIGGYTLLIILTEVFHHGYYGERGFAQSIVHFLLGGFVASFLIYPFVLSFIREKQRKGTEPTRKRGAGKFKRIWDDLDNPPKDPYKDD